MATEKVETRPKEGIIRTVDRAGKVGIMDNDTWVVGWQQPNGEIVWHKHSDVWRVFRQNVRVIERFLGTPLDEKDVNEAAKDPNLGISLPQVRDELVILGEVQKAQELALKIQRVVTQSRVNPMAQILPEIRAVGQQLSPRVTNQFKVLARQKLDEATSARNIPKAQVNALEAFSAMLDRAHEGASIISSLIQRASTILEWVDEHERKIDRLKTAVGAALVEIRIAQSQGREVSQNTVESWLSRFSGSTNILDAIFAMRGNPYALEAKRREIVNLRNVPELIDGNDITTVKKRFEEAYPTLQRIMQQRHEREASGSYNRYRLPKK